jgi:hypothetical protein
MLVPISSLVAKEFLASSRDDDLDDAEVRKPARNAEDGENFEQFWNGNTPDTTATRRPTWLYIACWRSGLVGTAHR